MVESKNQITEHKVSSSGIGVPPQDPIDMLTINEGMKEQMVKMKEDKIESAKLHENEPLKVRVESDKDKKAVEQLAESFEDVVISDKKKEKQEKKNKEKLEKKEKKDKEKLEKKEKKKSKDIEPKEKEPLEKKEKKKDKEEKKKDKKKKKESGDDLMEDAKKNLKQAKDSMGKLQESIPTSSDTTTGEKQQEGSWIKEGLQGAAEEAKEIVGDALNYVKGIFTKNPEEQKGQEQQELKEDQVKKQQQQDVPSKTISKGSDSTSLEQEESKTITEKIVDSLEIGKEKVLHAFGLDSSQEDSNKKSGGDEQKE